MTDVVANCAKSWLVSFLEGGFPGLRHGNLSRLHRVSDKTLNIAAFTVLRMHAAVLHESDIV